MIPQEQLQDLKPLPSQVKIDRLVKGKPTIHYRKGKNVLTKRARQFSLWNGSTNKGGEPKGYKWKGTPKKEDRK